MSIIPNADLPQRLPQATVLKRAGFLRISFCPGWGMAHFIVVDKFDSVGRIVLRVRFQVFKLVLQLVGMIEQG